MKKVMIILIFLISSHLYALDIEKCNSATVKKFEYLQSQIDRLDDKYSDEFLGILEFALNQTPTVHDSCEYVSASLDEFLLGMKDLIDNPPTVTNGGG